MGNIPCGRLNLERETLYHPRSSAISVPIVMKFCGDPMTERIYYTDSYRTAFDATVTAVTEWEGQPALVLDRTCFYPTSGGQPYDTGTLAGLHVVDVVAANGDIYHVLDKLTDPERLAHIVQGQTAQGQIDWPRRFDHMQQHSGQHLISQVFHKLFGYETISVHFGDQESTLDLDTPEVTSDALDQAERLVTQQVYQAIPIKAYFLNDTEIDSIPLRRPPKVSGQIRIIEIVDTDWSACGGTHVHTTAEIGPVKFIRQQRMRGQARLSFLCGQRARMTNARKHRTNHHGLRHSMTTKSDKCPTSSLAIWIG